MLLSIDYFINKFNEIPDEMIKVSTEDDSYDAWEWCSPLEADSLSCHIDKFETTLLEANDGIGDWAGVTNKTPKQRILMFLNILKGTQDECYKAF